MKKGKIIFWYWYPEKRKNIHLLAAKDVVKPGIGYVYNWSKSTSKVEGIWIGVREKPQAVISIISLWLSEHRSWWVVIVFSSHWLVLSIDSIPLVFVCLDLDVYDMNDLHSKFLFFILLIGIHFLRIPYIVRQFVSAF